MGWDMFAEGPRGGRLRPSDLAAFRAASDDVAKRAGTVDGLLRDGALDCSACAFALEEATGQNAWDDWSSNAVGYRQRTAVWSNVDQEPWARESAKAFLNTCAALGLSARASY